MEPKKNPVYDVHHYRPLIFGASLSVSLLVVIILFEWSVRKIDRMVLPQEASLSATPLLENLLHEVKPEEPVKQKIQEVNPDKIVEVKDDPTITQDDPELVVEPITSNVPQINVEIDPLPEEPVGEDIFRIVENMPEPEGGLEGFYKLLKKHMKYPSKAQRNHTEGRVFVEFTVGKDGKLTNMKVIKGVGDGCDEEALRVMAMSKWKPGKQRGVPVNVRMVQAINFQLR
ncbi:energy transducer TonB [Chryseotalea sanaruensis]|nr:energy transducer TonB [Chryseotalea sanaruensis]